jgi:hypothetical protein
MSAADGWGALLDLLATELSYRQWLIEGSCLIRRQVGEDVRRIGKAEFWEGAQLTDARFDRGTIPIANPYQEGT